MIVFWIEPASWVTDELDGLLLGPHLSVELAFEEVSSFLGRLFCEGDEWELSIYLSSRETTESDEVAHVWWGECFDG